MHNVIKVDRAEMARWISDQLLEWKDYSSCSLKGQMLRLQFVASGMYRVLYGNISMYTGDNIQEAIDSYESSQLRFR